MRIYRIKSPKSILSSTKVLFKNLKKVFNGEIRLKTLVKDTFCKSIETPVKNVRHEGDTFAHVPEFMTQAYSSAGVKVRNIKFPAVEEAKMAKMSQDEIFNYKKMLIEKGNYTYE